MSQIINELATIEVSHEAIQHLNLAGIYKSFSDNYKKLDDLKNFRSDYEKQNAAMRWWHNDKLRDAQLNSAEVQGEFSKTIGQLMLISIMQSKKLAEQQGLLNEQQQKLQVQAGRIADQAGMLQGQHHTLTTQAAELKQLVLENIELKGLTENGARRLIEVAREVKATKDSLAQHVDERVLALEARCDSVTAQLRAAEAELAERTRSSLHAMQQDIDGLQARLTAHAHGARRVGAGLSAVALGTLLGVAHLLGWF